MFWEVFLALSCVKVLFLHSYTSTDFEVHRNWLAVTHSLPMQQWYTDSCSIWTLDYPPFFAYFEWFLSQFAVVFDPEMLRIKNHDYASAQTLLFQRLSVILSDITLALGVKYCGGEYLGILGNAGLLLVDHVHFQYNGFLFGFLFLSMGSAKKGNYLWSAFWFAVLCNFKHIFAYAAPAYVVYLLSAYCFSSGRFKPHRLVFLGTIVISICLLSFGPFIYFGQLQTVLQRLFPFKRGLVHAYWAPNFWAVYNSLDKALALLLRRPSGEETARMTGGLVQEYSHSVLPSVAPGATLLLTLATMLPALTKLWRNNSSSPNGFIGAIVLCSWSSFLFGWHVHEKAILLIVLPLALLAYNDKSYSKIYFLASVVGHFSLFPLLFQPRETFLKVSILLCHSVYSYNSLFLQDRRKGKGPLLTLWEKLYLGGLGFVFLFEVLLFPQIALLARYEFLPLMLYSLYCACGVSYTWVLMYKKYLQ